MEDSKKEWGRKLMLYCQYCENLVERVRYDKAPTCFGCKQRRKAERNQRARANRNIQKTL